MKTSATTLGCPEWDLDTIIANYAAYGFDAVDFRGVKQDLDITVTPAFTTGLAETKQKLADAGLAVSGISTSLLVCDAGRREANLEEAKRTIPIALELGVPNLRIFGGGDLEKRPREELAKQGAALIAELLALDGGQQVCWCVETHDQWCRSAEMMTLLAGAENPCVGVLWDVFHTIRHGESPAESLAGFKGRVRYTHFKDGLPDEAWRMVSLGDGTLPMADAVAALGAAGYTGYLALEQEKRWHDELEPPEVAFPKAVKWFRAQLGA